MIMTQPPPAELPLQLLGAVVALKLTTGDTLSGEIFCYDMKVTNTIVLKEAIDVSHANFHLIKTNNIREVSAKTLPPICVPNVYLPPCSTELLNSREKNALDKFQKIRHTIGIHVTQEAQDIFDFIHKTHPECSWSSENKIRVMGVTVSPPYQQENCEGSGKALERIKQVLEKFHQRRRLDVKNPTPPIVPIPTQSMRDFYVENQAFMIPQTTSFGQVPGHTQPVVFVDHQGVRVAGPTTDGRLYSYPGSSGLFMMVLPRTAGNPQDERIVSGLPLGSGKPFNPQKTPALGQQVFQAPGNPAIRTTPLVFTEQQQQQQQQQPQFMSTTSTATVDDKPNSGMTTGPLDPTTMNAEYNSAATQAQPFLSTAPHNCNVPIPSSPSTYQQNLYAIPSSAAGSEEHYASGGIMSCVASYQNGIVRNDPNGAVAQSGHFGVSSYQPFGTLIQPHPTTTAPFQSTNGEMQQAGNVSVGQAYNSQAPQYHKHMAKWSTGQLDHSALMSNQVPNTNTSIGLPSMYTATNVTEPVMNNEGTSSTSPPLTNGTLSHEHELLGTTSNSTVAPSSIINATHLPMPHSSYSQRGNRKPSRSQRNRGNRRRD